MKLIFIFSFLLLLAPLASAYSVIIYENEACGHCGPYVSGLKSALMKAGITDITEKFILNDRQAASELEQLQNARSVPLLMRGHFVTSVDGKYLFEGHVPPALIIDFLQNPSQDSLVVTQDLMSTDVKSYYMLMGGEIKTCGISEKFSDCTHDTTASFDNSNSNTYSTIIYIALAFAIAIAGLSYLSRRAK